MSLHDEIGQASPMQTIEEEPLPVGTERLVGIWHHPDVLSIELKQDKNMAQGDGFKLQSIPIA